MRRRVKITGIGPVTPAGIGRKAFSNGINGTVSRIHALQRFDAEAGPFVGAEVLDFDLKKFFPEENPRRLSRHTQMSLVAAMLAMEDAGVTREEVRNLSPLAPLFENSSLDLLLRLLVLVLIDNRI